MGVYMPFDVQDEIIEIRERLARIETRICALLEREEPQPKSTGAIVIPVAVVIAGLEVLRVLFERLA